MDVIEAINTRRSIRGYKPTPIDKATLEALVEVASRAPSWANSQPWEFVIVGGKVMEELKTALSQKQAIEAPINPDIPWPTLPQIYLDRRGRNMARLMETAGIARSARQKRVEWYLSMYRFFSAPNAIYIYASIRN